LLAACSPPTISSPGNRELHFSVTSSYRRWDTVSQAEQSLSRNDMVLATELVITPFLEGSARRCCDTDQEEGSIRCHLGQQ
jgi:hypothetical protein